MRLDMTPLHETSNSSSRDAKLPLGCWRNRGRGGYEPCDHTPTSDLGLCDVHLSELQEADR